MVLALLNLMFIGVPVLNLSKMYISVYIRKKKRIEKKVKVFTILQDPILGLLADENNKVISFNR